MGLSPTLFALCKSTLYTHSLSCYVKTRLSSKNNQKPHVPGSQQDPRELTAAPTTCQDGAPGFGVKVKSNDPSPPLFAIDTSLHGDALAAMLA